MAATKPLLYWFPVSHHARLARYYLLAANVPHDLAFLDLPKGEQKAPAFLKINPNGQVPTVVTPSGLGIWESGTILRHFARQNPTPLYPLDNPELLARIETAYEQVRLKAWIAATDYVLESTLKEAVFKVKGDAHIAEISKKKLAEHFGLLNSYYFKESPLYMVGTELSFADIQLAVLLSQLGIVKYDLAPYPAIANFYENIQKTQLFKDAHKEFFAALAK